MLQGLCSLAASGDSPEVFHDQRCDPVRAQIQITSSEMLKSEQWSYHHTHTVAGGCHNKLAARSFGRKANIQAERRALVIWHRITRQSKLPPQLRLQRVSSNATGHLILTNSTSRRSAIPQSNSNQRLFFRIHELPPPSQIHVAPSRLRFA